jgi:hypothetical protein
MNSEPVGPWPGHEYPEDVVEEGIDLPRISGEHGRTADHLEPRDNDRVVLDFVTVNLEGPQPYLAIRVARDGVAIDAEVLGLVEATSKAMAKTLSRVHWETGANDVILWDREGIRLALDDEVPRRPLQ